MSHSAVPHHCFDSNDGPDDSSVLTHLPPVCDSCGRVDFQDIYTSLRVLQSLVDLMGAAPTSKFHSQAENPRASPDGRKANWASREVGSHEGITTVMMRHIPNRYTQAELIAEVTFTGFGGTFDFFYLPMDHSTRANFGYCFINFTTPEVASLFTHLFSGKQLNMSTSKKIVEIVPAKLQGFDANLLHYSKKAVSTDSKEEFRPLFLVDGYRLSFTRVPLQKPREMGRHSSRQRSACSSPERSDKENRVGLASNIGTLLKNACHCTGDNPISGEERLMGERYAPFGFNDGQERFRWMKNSNEASDDPPSIQSPDFPIFLDGDHPSTIGETNVYILKAVRV
ncbi:hypothetical protein Pmar_PMAR000952 [Perkinsus marinus ATCC 50983]|uniref:Mei2-like C-terminal RNA recognition motif domain-containing protein n=1 Tax=Perkinsus marinus (strain ATCC 50983 / TXsc) TaxID=423536 RepID=C5KP04_PERM5|nr:hypothetical protein Pmar_PMAR000952 [Perkinsus marinus ATCC 50983]EER13792.1 hypothetical protein Pmar_PMAR000952 [Perkinsus marinus ATCC 50983]|eukprot:XP_002781997.1 hypothetical protein Pmar_PMAR000952 [Perkinsus marinus ATCC 50983]